MSKNKTPYMTPSAAMLASISLRISVFDLTNRNGLDGVGQRLSDKK
jgi:hypothetical protein